MGFESDEMSYAGRGKGTSCKITSWDGTTTTTVQHRERHNNPSPYYPGPALHCLPRLDTTFVNHYKDTVSMIAQKLASKLLSDPFGDWRIDWVIYVPIFTSRPDYIGETFEITSWESFQMSMPNPQGPQALENESHWFRFVSHLGLQFLKINKKI